MRYLSTVLLVILCATGFAQDQNVQLVENSACNFLNSIKDLDYAQAKVYGTDNTAKMLEMMASFTSMMPDSVKDEAKKISFNISNIEVQGNKAKITFTGSDAPDKPEIIKLIKKNDIWLVDMEMPQSPQMNDNNEVDATIELVE